MRPKTNVIKAVEAAKEEMRQKFWQDHVRVRDKGSLRVVPTEKLIHWCEEHHASLGVRSDNTVSVICEEP